MKLHLPISLRRSLLSLVLSAAAAIPAWAGVLTNDVDAWVYADFGQNRGRYSVTNVNALLRDLNADGVYIHYNNGHDSYKLENGMISFESRQEAGGSSAAINHNFIATVQHNGVQNPYFSYLELGGEKHAIQYKGIEYRGPYGGAFLHDKSGRDFKITRLNKIVTDVTTSSVYSVEKLKEEGLAGKLMYHSGGGRTFIYDPDTETYLPMENPDDSYNVNGTLGHFIQGAIQKIDDMGGPADGGFWFVHTVDGWKLDTDPLPFGAQSGDSGSPVWVWDDDAKEYKYIAAVQQSSDNNPAYGASMSNLTYMQEVADSYDKVVESSQSVITIGATENTHQTISQDSVSTTLWQGKVTDASGTLASFTGVEKGKSTWNNMEDIRDKDNWYALTQDYLNARQNNTDASSLDYADLFMTDNLVFNAKDRTDYTIQVDSVVDTGIGYTEFTKGNQDKASYTISGKGYLDSAGYIIGEDVEVHLKLLSTGKTREVRKIGDGTLVVNGTGDNDIMLNLGGKGSTILNQTNGYAAYNVLANNGTTVQLLGGISQIKRDFTFGNGGATLDFAGHDWKEGAEGHFSMKALTQDAVITNSSDRTIQLNFTKGGSWLGSFADTAKAGIQVNYSGTGTWELNSIHTHLQHKDSGLTVSGGGHVIFQGTITEHGISQLIYPEKNANGWNEAMCWQKENDWHYADARMNVTVDKGTFELGSHARLTGTVTVNSNASYIMREGVQNRYEYIEGGYALEDTYAISEYYGHKGNTVLDGGTLQVEFSDGTSSNLTYAGDITGSGSMTVDTADGSLTLTGNNTFYGSKTLEGGHLIAEDTVALGTGPGWKLAAGTTLTVQSGLTSDNALTFVDAANSSGLLALGNDLNSALQLQGSDLYIGAEAGKVVQYGAEKETITAPKLGGGGGTLVVNAVVAAENLVVGRDNDSGVVRLTNEANQLSGTISMAGNVALDATSAALGNAKVNLAYGKGLVLHDPVSDIKGKLTGDSAGSLLLDFYDADSVNMTGMTALSLSAAADDAVYDGTIQVGASEFYRLGGYTGSLSLSNHAALKGSNALMVDAKGTIGGKVVLAAQTSYTGAVTVQDGSPGKNGSVSLCFSEDNALDGASSVTVKDGGILDVGSTTQTLTNLVVQTGGLLKGNADGTLVFNMTTEVNGNNAYFQTGAMQLGKVEKTGAGEMVLASADNSWDLFTVKQGTLFTRVNNALSATGITRVESGAILSMNAWDANRTMHGNVVLGDGGRMETGGGNNIFFNGTISVDAGTTGTLGSGTWYLTHTRHNIDGGTLNLEGGNLRFESTDAQRVGGTLDIATNDVTFHSISANGADNMLKQFDHVNVAAGKTLSIKSYTWNTIWKLDELTGEGTVTWDSTTQHSKTDRLILSGDGAYEGVINVNRNSSNDSFARTYQAYLQIDGAEAISSATVNLTGTNDNNSHVTLALNADRVKVGGLNGNAYSHLFAGAVPAAAASSAAASTRQAALVITGSGNYTYSGSIGAASDFASKGVSIEMAGTGVQQFNGSSVVVQNIALQNTGSLDFSGVTSLNVQGDIALNAAGSLNLGNHTYSLDAGNSLSALAAGAGFTANLELNGGTIVFDASALTQAGAMLNYSGTLTSATGATIDFTNLGSLYQSGGNNTYVLASGDWSGVLSSLSGSNLGQYKAEFSVNSDKALVVTFSDNGHIWGGAASSHEWSASGFMTEAGMKEYNASSNLVFRDSAANAVVNVSGSVSASGLYFENSEKDYTVAGSTGRVSADSISQSGSATTTFTVATSVKNIDVTAGKLDLQQADLNGGRLKVENGTLALRISDKETASLLYLGKDARFELSGNRRLTVSNGGVKDVAGETSVVLNGSSTILQDVKSTYNIANASLHVKEGTDGQGQMFVRSAQLADGGVLSVDGANLGVTEGIGFNSESDALVEVKNNAVLVLDAVKGKGVLHSSSMPAAEEEESEDEAAEDIVVPTHRVMVKDGGALFSAGSSAEGNLSLELGDNAVLGTSAELADYASDIKLVGSEATLTSNGYFVSVANDLKFSSKKGVLKVSGNIVSEHNHANLVIAGSSTYDVNDVGVQLAGTASVIGDVKIGNSSVLRMVGALGDGDFPGMTYRQDAGVKISSRDGKKDAVIAGGSSMGLLANAHAYVYGKETGSTHISNARIELYSGAALNLKNLTLIDTDSIIQLVEGARDAATVSMENVSFQISAAGAEAVLADAMTLQAFGGDATYTLEAGARVLDITSDMLGGALTVSGNSLEILFQGYDFNSYDAVRLSFGSDVMLDSGLNISGSLVSVQRSSDGGYVSLTASYEGNGGSTSTIVFVTSTETIPEPATAALSLLGLAALAARRRRKA